MIRIFYTLTILTLFLTSCTKERRVAYVELVSVFEEFEYTKELKKELSKINEKRRFVLDSIGSNLEAQYQLVKDRNEMNEDFRNKLQEYKDLKYRFNESEQELSKTYDEKIYKQLNQYVKEFGEVKGYDFILGANGSGNLMYADSTLNITKDVILFINQKYKGR